MLSSSPGNARWAACWEQGWQGVWRAPACSRHSLLTQGLPSFCLDLVTQRHPKVACKEPGSPSQTWHPSSEIHQILSLLNLSMFLLKLLNFDCPLEFLSSTGLSSSTTSHSPFTSFQRWSVSAPSSCGHSEYEVRTCLPPWSHRIFVCSDSEALCNVAPCDLSSVHSSQFLASLGAIQIPPPLSTAALTSECASVDQVRVPPFPPDSPRRPGLPLLPKKGAVGCKGCQP